MFEKGKPWWELDPSEIHAGGYALITLAQGLNPLRREPAVKYSQIDTLDISPEWKADLKLKYHYYLAMYEGPELAAYLFTLAFGAFTALKTIGVIP